MKVHVYLTFLVVTVVCAPVSVPLKAAAPHPLSHAQLDSVYGGGAVACHFCHWQGIDTCVTETWETEGICTIWGQGVGGCKSAYEGKVCAAVTACGFELKSCEPLTGYHCYHIPDMTCNPDDWPQSYQTKRCETEDPVCVCNMSDEDKPCWGTTVWCW